MNKLTVAINQFYVQKCHSQDHIGTEQPHDNIWYIKTLLLFSLPLSAISKPRLDLVHKTLMVFVNATLQWRKLC